MNEYLSLSEILELLDKIEIGWKSPKDTFYEDGNKVLKKFLIQGVLTVECEENHHLRNCVICNVFGCNQTFESVSAFESHYNTLHRYLCNICKKNLPSSYFLDLHLSEQHDSFFAVQAERKPMYSCFIQECQEKFPNPEERKDHCFRIHKFPTNFRYDKSNTLTVKNRCQSQPENILDNSPTSSTCDKKEIPPSVTKMTNFSFGYQNSKVFNNSNYAKVLTKNKPSIQQINDSKSPLDDHDIIVSDLMENLPCVNYK